MYWKVRAPSGKESIRVVSSIMAAVHSRPQHGWSVVDGQARPEFQTVVKHWKLIFDSTYRGHRLYALLPFHPDWNPQQGGAFWKGAKWIVENLGPKPGPGYSLDIIQHSKGFVPGNLRWATRSEQNLNRRPYKHAA